VATDELLNVEDLHVSFPLPERTVRALKGVSFDLRRKRLVGLIGETGSGKSVTARALLGILRPPGRVDRGSVKFLGRELVGLSDTEMQPVRGLGMSFIPQDPIGALDPVLSIEKQFANVLKRRGLDRLRSYRVAADALAGAGIADPERVLRSYAHQMSGGMAQRVVIAIAMSLDPQLVIADEPTTGLDVTIQRQILDLIATKFRAEQRALLIVTHDLGVVAEYCDDVMVMYAGKLVETGPARTVFAKPSHPYTKLLVDSLSDSGVGERRFLSADTTADVVVGCPFRSRCVYAFEACESLAPDLTGRPHGVTASCHLPSLEIEAERVAARS
jgi:peptide/nickel transport system ATP-binding protein